MAEANADTYYVWKEATLKQRRELVPTHLDLKTLSTQLKADGQAGESTQARRMELAILEWFEAKR
jgi:hypothetical protein